MKSKILILVLVAVLIPAFLVFALYGIKIQQEGFERQIREVNASVEALRRSKEQAVSSMISSIKADTDEFFRTSTTKTAITEPIVLVTHKGEFYKRADGIFMFHFTGTVKNVDSKGHSNVKILIDVFDYIGVSKRFTIYPEDRTIGPGQESEIIYPDQELGTTNPKNYKIVGIEYD